VRLKTHRTVFPVHLLGKIHCPRGQTGEKDKLSVDDWIRPGHQGEILAVWAEEKTCISQLRAGVVEGHRFDIEMVEDLEIKIRMGSI